MSKYNEYKNLKLSEVADEVLKFWKDNNIFEKSISSRDENKPFVFFEGPPSANGLPGIHHVMGRAIKDIFCRYKTLKGFRVDRKAGWDTHGLPVELSVEKELGITKEDIGKKISIEEYNIACRKAVMKYTDIWSDLTEKMGYWVDMDDPYVTYENKYMESVWWLLKQIYNKDLLYKGYTIQPYSPAAGTGLSSHEINQPGAYQDVKDTTVVAQFKVNQKELNKIESAFDLNKLSGDYHFIAWTTTPWTLPSNTALAVGLKIDYVLVSTTNQYTNKSIHVILAKNLIQKQFGKGYYEVTGEEFGSLDKKGIPFKIIGECKGTDLVGIEYDQLLPYTLPFENTENAFKVIKGDFVTTEDGTGIVHIAPTFGADDAQVAKEAGVPPMLVLDENENPVPLVDLRGRFRNEINDEVFLYGGEFVKEEYLSLDEKEIEFNKQKKVLEKNGKIRELKEYLNVDKRIALKLQEEDKLFKKETYEHSYPHCWRTDKPILYYPLDSWFIKITDVKERMAELNKTINWKPKSTGEGRFGNWLENANDWNLSRSRFWGIPIPIWRTEEGTEQICIGSAEELKSECQKAVDAGLMSENPLANFEVGNMSDDNYNTFDFHKNYVDAITLVSASGQPMKRESDLIDVWFDSGSMPIAQRHYPFENKELIDNKGFGTGDFIAEGVDQTRGWFYTLHAISTMVFDKVAYKNVISNGLVLDKNGHKMSKRLGNGVEPFENLSIFGADATRWYMITNAQPWDNLKFDNDGITETSRKFFGTLQNTYSFFSLYANLDGFDYSKGNIPLENRTESDRWVISKLNSLVTEVDAAFNEYEPTRAGRLIQNYVMDDLSNWYVRLNRKRFWIGDYTDDKRAAYQTLYTCLETVSKLMSPIAPFYADKLFRDLNAVTGFDKSESVHLAEFPISDESVIHKNLEERMGYAQTISSLVHSLRKKEKIKVRQPLQKVMIPSLGDDFKTQVLAIEDLIKSEVNIKEISFIEDGDDNSLVKNIKPNFAKLGRVFGKQMKLVAAEIGKFGQDEIQKIESDGSIEITLEGEKVTLALDDVEIQSKDIPGWMVASEGKLTVALDVTISDELKKEGIARDLVNRIQNLRKDKGFEVQDKIDIQIKGDEKLVMAINTFNDYICQEVQANKLEFVSDLNNAEEISIDDLKFELSIN